MTNSLKNIIRGFVAVIILLGVIYGAVVFYQTRPRQIITGLLHLDRAPASLANSECASWGMTDVLTTCVFQVDPTDFPALTKGWQFNPEPAHGGSYTFSGGPKIGPNFPVSAAFAVNNPPEFLHGGRVSLVTDTTQSWVQLDYYEE
jgi:hypothetical protein